MASAKTLELFKDESFLKKLMEKQTAEEAQKLFEANGGEISIGELNAIRKKLQGDALTDDDLENVAGGMTYLEILQPVAIPEDPLGIGGTKW